MQLYYQTAIIGRRDLALAPDPRSGFEMTLLRMLAFRPGRRRHRRRRQRAHCGARRAAAPRRAPRAARRAQRRAGRAAAAGSPWAQILGQLELTGAARQLASHCVFIGRQGAVVRLALDPRNQLLRTAALEEKLAQALARYYGETRAAGVPGGRRGARDAGAGAAARLGARSWPPRGAPSRPTPGVKGLRERFGATVLPRPCGR